MLAKSFTRIVSHNAFKGNIICSRSFLGMDTSRTHYDVLGLKTNATKEEIKSRYLELCKQYHPDTAATQSKDNGSKLIEIMDAYQTLGNEFRRSQYDISINMGNNMSSRYKSAGYKQPSGGYEGLSQERAEEMMRRMRERTAQRSPLGHKRSKWKAERESSDDVRAEREKKWGPDGGSRKWGQTAERGNTMGGYSSTGGLGDQGRQTTSPIDITFSDWWKSINVDLGRTSADKDESSPNNNNKGWQEQQFEELQAKAHGIKNQPPTAQLGVSRKEVIKMLKVFVTGCLVLGTYGVLDFIEFWD